MNALRRKLLKQEISLRLADLAHDQLAMMDLQVYDYLPVAARVWQLKDNVTPYDAWYVALAEYLATPLVTLDCYLIRSPGPRCEFVTFQQ